MAEKSKFIRDIGQVLYDKIKDYIVPLHDIRLGDNIGSGFFADVYEGQLISKGMQVAAKRKKGRI